MPIEPIPVEMVHQIPSEEQILKDHFNFFYQQLADSKAVSYATFEKSFGVSRCLSGLTEVFYNVVLGAPEDNLLSCVEEQVQFFLEKKTPFVWYLTKDANPIFEKALLAKGFQNIGTFKGMIGTLSEVQEPVVPEGYILELIQDEASLEEFNKILCAEFSLQETTKDPLKKALSNLAAGPMYHYAVKKEGKIVSILSTLIQGNLVSFWNCATLLEERKKGLSTALLRLALKDAILKGCNTGASYLMTEGMALGICEKLGYEKKWEFNLFLSP